MTSLVQIMIIGVADGRKLLSINLNEKDSVFDVKRAIAEQSGLNIAEVSVRLIVAGVELKDDNQLVSDLHIGTNTRLHAIICEVYNADVKTLEHENGDNVSNVVANRKTWKSQFYVFCKVCNSLQPGKMRMRCDLCKSNGILLSSEPSCWNDILHNRIACLCLENKCLNSRATFYFKCIPCSSDNEVAPLTQVKSNTENVACSICDEIQNPLVQFYCAKKHVLCLHCFVLNGQITLEDRNFVLEPNFGYTMPCPAGCPDSYIMDPHHFRLLGADSYERYQKLSAEMYVLGEGGVFCPSPNCGAGFLPESNDVDGNLLKADILICPECKFAFCRHCKQRASDCYCKNGADTQPKVGENILTQVCSANTSNANFDLNSYVAVKTTSRPCPRCKAPTFKDGGCNHISCSVCRFPWCWVCLTEWKDDCQWNHWFE